MDWLTFIAELVKAIAWPGTLLILLLFLRKPIADLIPLLRKLKYKEFEAEFGARLEEVETLEAEVTAETAPPEPVDSEDDAPMFSRRARTTDHAPLAFRLAETSPRSAILEAWLGIETEAKAAVTRLKILPITPRPFLEVIRVLTKANVLSSAQISMLHELRALRNEAAHSADVALSSETALRYVDLAFSLRKQLTKLGR